MSRRNQQDVEVVMRSRSAGPEGVLQPGRRYVVSKKFADELIAGNYAELYVKKAGAKDETISDSDDGASDGANQSGGSKKPPAD